MRKPYLMQSPCAQCGRRIVNPETKKLEICQSNKYYICPAFQKKFLDAWENTALFLIHTLGMDPRRHHPHPQEHNKEYPPHPDEKPEEPEEGAKP